VKTSAKNSQDFRKAQGINFALGNLYDLVAQNRISTRRAAVLAYINSAIDYDRQNKITNPRAKNKAIATAASLDAFLTDLDATKKPL